MGRGQFASVDGQQSTVALYLCHCLEHMGIPSLLQEDVIPSLTTVAARSLGVEALKNPQEEPLRFRYSLPGTTRVVSLFEIFVPDFWKSNYADGAFFKDRVVVVGATAEVARLSLHAVGQAFRSRNQPPRPCCHASRKLAQAGGARVNPRRDRLCRAGRCRSDYLAPRRSKMARRRHGWRSDLMAGPFALRF